MKSITQVVQNLLKPYIDRKDRAVEAEIATVETNASSASKAYAAGDQLVFNDILYKVTAPISQGGTLTVGTNITPGDKVTSQIGALTNQLGALGLSVVNGKLCYTYKKEY